MQRPYRSFSSQLDWKIEKAESEVHPAPAGPRPKLSPRLSPAVFFTCCQAYGRCHCECGAECDVCAEEAA